MIEFRSLAWQNTGNLEKRLKSLYKKIFKGRAYGRFELSVVLAPPFLMRSLNKRYRRKNKGASVLSFLLEKGWGEIFLNSREKDLPYLFTHGALHLLGYSHKQNKNAKKMESFEKKIYPVRNRRRIVRL